MKIRLLFAFVLLNWGIFAIAQESETIDIERPDQSEGVGIMAKNTLQIENGFTFSKNTFEDNLMLRYGIFKGTEVRFATDISKATNQKTQVEDLVFSFKHHLTEEKDVLPAVTLVGYLEYNNDLSSKTWGADYFKNLNVTAEVVYSPIEKLSLFAEYFAIFGKFSPSHNADAGVMYVINPNF